MTETGSGFTKMEQFGWDERWRQELAALRLQGARPARVVMRRRDGWTLATAGGELRAVSRIGAAAPARDEPAVGDWVAVRGADPAMIVAVLPRRSAFVRRAAGRGMAAQVVAANVDLGLVAVSLVEPFNARRLERYVALAWSGGAVPLVVLTKLDLAGDPAVGVVAAADASPGVEVLAVSAATGEGLAALESRLPAGATAVLLGPSGVGKSTLINRLLGEERLATGPVAGDGRGRHTTTHRELVRTRSGALLIDTPGMREVGMWGGSEALDAAFTDIGGLAEGCRFRDCRHDTEPDCAVRSAIADGRLDRDRLEGWRKLDRELAHLARRADPLAAQAERARTKSLHRRMRRDLRRKRP